MGSEYNTDHENLVDDRDRLRGRVKALEQANEALQQQLKDQAEMHSRQRDIMERSHAAQVKVHLDQVQKNAEKIGEALQIKIQFDALKAEHAKCASYVESREFKQLKEKHEVNLAALRAAEVDKERLRRERNDALEALRQLEEIPDEPEDEDDEPGDDYTWDEIFDRMRDIVRDELRAERRRRERS